MSRVVSELADKIGMKRVGRVRRIENNCGVVYMQLIQESHIAAHTHYDGRVLFSVVSCKRFNERRAIEYITQELELRNVKTSSSYRNFR